MASFRQFIDLQNGSFDPDATRIMGEAFDAACALLGNISDPARATLADRIVAEARSGERNPIRLRDAGMDALKRPYKAAS